MSRLGSVYTQMIDVHAYGEDLERVHFRSAFPTTHRPTSGFIVRGVISYNSRSHLVFLQVKVNSARYFEQVVNLQVTICFDPWPICLEEIKKKH